MIPSGTRVPAPLFAAIAAWGLLLVLAPPESNFAWAVNGFRSAFPLAAFASLALLAAGIALVVRGPRFEPWVIGGVALALAFPLRERVHLLGDTALRHRILDVLADPAARLLSTGDLARTIHSQPLDTLVTVGIPVWLSRLGVPPALAVAIVGAMCFLCLHEGVRRAIGGDGVSLAPALAAVVWLSGLLLLFAGYADGWPLTLAIAAWWWWSLDRPHPTPGHAALPAALWLALVLGHRLGWVMLAPMAWRALRPARTGDGARARAGLAVATIVAAAAAAAFGSASGGSRVPQDVAELIATVAGPGGPRLVPAWDLANLLVLVMPLAFLAPGLADSGSRAAFARSESAPLFAVALVPLLPMLLLFAVAPHGLGAHRDWDLAALPALLAGLASARLLARTGDARLRRGLLLLLPVLALQAGGWLAVNADTEAGARRARALVDGPGALRGEQASHAHVFLGYHAAALLDFAGSARHFERSAREMPNPRHELFAAQAWLAADEPRRARAAFERAMTFEPLPPEVRATAESVRAMLARHDAPGP